MRRADQIELKGIRLQAPSAAGPGACRVDVRMRLDLLEAARRERIDRTVDYREVHRRLCQAARRCQGDLAESLARAVLDGFPLVEEVEVAGGDRPPVRLGRRGRRGTRR